MRSSLAYLERHLSIAIEHPARVVEDMINVLRTELLQVLNGWI